MRPETVCIGQDLGRRVSYHPRGEGIIGVPEGVAHFQTGFLPEEAEVILGLLNSDDDLSREAVERCAMATRSPADWGAFWAFVARLRGEDGAAVRQGSLFDED